MIKKFCDYCGVEIIGYGNNGDPLVPNGIVCDNCNTAVILKRLYLINKRKEDKDASLS